MDSKKYEIFRPDEMPSIDRGNGARTIPLVNAQVGAEDFLNGVTVFEPGSQVAHHLHNVAESVMVIKGTALVNVDGQEHLLNTFDTTFVPAGIPHHFKNASETQEMRIFWTYGSIEATRTILETGVTTKISSEQA